MKNRHLCRVHYDTNESRMNSLALQAKLQVNYLCYIKILFIKFKYF